MFDRLGLAVKEVAACDPLDLSDEELAETVVELQRQRDALEAAHARLAAAFEGRRGYAGDGAKSASAWLARKTRAPKAACGALLWAGREARHLPLAAAAWEVGAIGREHVCRLSKARNSRTLEALARDEAMLVAQAMELTFTQFCQVVSYWLLHADPDGTDQDAQDRRDRRRVSLDQTYSGMFSGAMFFDPVSGTIVANELNRLETELFRADWDEATERLGREPSLSELGRTPDQRRADALVEMARRSSRPDAAAGTPARPLFTVVLGQERFGHLCQLESGQVVAPTDLRPWISEADLERILFEGFGDRVISVSRRRRFTGALRRLLEVRDQTCFHDFCEEPSSRCQGDHIVPWSEGGMTEQSNGQMACGFHNRGRNRRGPPEESDAT